MIHIWKNEVHGLRISREAVKMDSLVRTDAMNDHNRGFFAMQACDRFEGPVRYLVAEGPPALLFWDTLWMNRELRHDGNRGVDLR